MDNLTIFELYYQAIITFPKLVRVVEIEGLHVYENKVLTEPEAEFQVDVLTAFSRGFRQEMEAAKNEGGTKAIIAPHPGTNRSYPRLVIPKLICESINLPIFDVNRPESRFLHTVFSAKGTYEYIGDRKLPENRTFVFEE